MDILNSTTMIDIKIEISIDESDIKDHNKLRVAVLHSLNTALREAKYGSTRDITQIGFEEIVNVVLEDYPDLTVEDLIQESRDTYVVEARHIAIYMCVQYTNLTPKRIGCKFGDMNRGSINHATSRVSDQIDAYPQYKNRIKLINNKIKNIQNLINNQPINNECATDNSKP